jgi:hypothetical protein
MWRSAAIDEAGDREAKRQFRTLAGVSANQRTARLAQDLVGACHQLRQRRLDLGLDAKGNRGYRKCRLRFSAHGVDIAKRVICRDAAEHVGVVDHRAEVVDSVDG